MFEEILKHGRDYVVSAISFSLGLLAMHVFELFKNKVCKLQYSINKNFLGASGNDNYFGKVQVLYNDAPVPKLYFFNVTLVNTSNKDFSNLIVTLWSDVDSVILSSRVQKAGTITPFSLSNDYIRLCENITKDNQKIVWTRRPYIIPVLNRDDVVVFSCLVAGSPQAEPNVYLDCEHSGLRVEPNFIQPQLFWGENRDLGAICGLVISAVLVLGINHCVADKFLVVSIAFLLGALCLLPGVVFLKTGRYFRKLIRQ